MSERPYSVGVDIGGTFTDCSVVDDEGHTTTGKALTTPEDRTIGFFAAIEEAAGRLGIGLEELLAQTKRLVHGTTTGTNALVVRDGATVGMLTTRGHRDALFIMKGGGRTSGLPPDRLMDVSHQHKPEPIVPRSRVREISQRHDVDGDVMVPLDREEVRAAVADLVAAGVDSLAISFLWSIRNPRHEHEAREVALEVEPDLFVTCGSDLVSAVGEYERTTTCVMNAFIGPLMVSYVERLEQGARERGYADRVLFTQCAGGAIGGEQTRSAPIRTVHSGPVAGVLSSRLLARHTDTPNVLVADMGGTSFDVAVIREGEPLTRVTSLFERFELALPMVDIESIGAGGGSIAWLDDSDRLNVGPRSATSNPGPACYGRGGTEPTVTDADLVLGILDPDSFFHGQIRLDVEKAEAAISPLARRLGLSIPEAAAGINRVADAKMADLLRRVCMVRGLDPRDFTCYAYGGGGPVHAASVCREAGIETVVVPMMNLAAVWSAFGAAGADVVHVYLSPEVMTLPVPGEAITAVFAELEGEANEALADEGIDPGDVVLERSLRVKHGRQVHAVDVPVKAGDLGDADVEQIDRDFTRIYEELFGKGAGSREGGIDITGFQVRAIGRTVDPVLAADATAAAEAPVVDQRVYWAELGGFAATPVVQAGEAGVGSEWLEGPALIRLPDTVIVVPPGQRAAGDGLGSVTIKTGSVQGQERKDIAHVA
jgi:N-methylhydantoinase A